MTTSKNRSRSNKALLNTIVSLLLELVTIVSSFILPRLILVAFGSKYNGITTAISQFLGYISIFAFGIGGPARAAIYKPLAEQDIDQVSRIVKASERFLRKIALFFAIGIMVFAIVYPFVVLDEFDWFFTFTMVLILGLGTFFQYVFGNAYSMLLQADQKQYITNIIQIVTVILNTLVAFVLIKMNLDIRIVKLGSSIVFSLNPIVIHYLVKRKYKINDKVIPDDSALKQRWDAFAHRIASFVFSNTDVVIISIFLTLKHVSVYSLYLLIANGLQKIVLSFMSGIEAAFGNMIAKKEKSSLKNNLNLSEFLIQSISVPVFATMALLVVPFLKLYTAGVTDINYALPSFGFLVSITFLIFCIRSPYELIIYAAGHYKQTKIGAIVESVLNITLSIALVFPLGLNGIMIGTLVAMSVRTIEYIVYVNKHLVVRDEIAILKRFVKSGILGIIIFAFFTIVPLFEATSYWMWIANALIIFVSSSLFVLLVSLVLNRYELNQIKNMIERILKKNKNRKQTMSKNQK